MRLKCGDIRHSLVAQGDFTFVSERAASIFASTSKDALDHILQSVLATLCDCELTTSDTSRHEPQQTYYGARGPDVNSLLTCTQPHVDIEKCFKGKSSFQLYVDRWLTYVNMLLVLY